MKLAIMQPYFLPYIGYYQLIAAADVFVVYDNIKYTKKGWINRNRMLSNGAEATFSLPLKRDSDSLNVVERTLAVNFDRSKLLNQFRTAYRRAPGYSETYPMLERIIRFDDCNLFRYVYNAIVHTCSHLGINTVIRISSDIAIDHQLKAQDKVIALCEALGADTYINPIGGTDLYSTAVFRSRNLELRFIRSTQFEYPQFGSAFVPWLSIVDALMFNRLASVQEAIYDSFEWM